MIATTEKIFSSKIANAVDFPCCQLTKLLPLTTFSRIVMGANVGLKVMNVSQCASMWKEETCAKTNANPMVFLVIPQHAVLTNPLGPLGKGSTKDRGDAYLNRSSSSVNYIKVQYAARW